MDNLHYVSSITYTKIMPLNIGRLLGLAAFTFVANFNTGATKYLALIEHVIY